MSRPGLKAILSEKIIEVFNWFENELEEVQKLYETHKVSCLLRFLLRYLTDTFRYLQVDAAEIST